MKYTGEEDVYNVIQFALSYTLQSLRDNEDIERFKWNK